MGGKFSWFKVEVWPVVAAVGVGCSFAVYSMTRNLWTNPDVHLSAATRSDSVPDNDIIDKRAAGYKHSVYRSIQDGKENTKIFG